MKQIHMRASIKGMLMRGDRELNGIVQDDSGRTLSTRDARRHLLELLEQGDNFIKVDPTCDNWCPKTGCLGHEVADNAKNEI